MIIKLCLSRWLSVETRRGKSGSPAPQQSASPAPVRQERETGPVSLSVSHPLTSLSNSPEHDSLVHVPPPPRLSPVTLDNIGAKLSANDVDRIRIMVGLCQ